MVIAPHMDDEVIGCGGALLLHRALQSEVRVVFVSDSSGAVDDPALARKLRDIRRAEMMKVRDVLALGSVVELGFADGALMSHEEAIASRLAEELRTFRPAQVLCPFPADGHADHQASAVALGHARRGSPAGTARCWPMKSGRRSGRTWRSTSARSPTRRHA